VFYSFDNDKKLLVAFPTELVFEYWLNDPNEEWLNGTKSACKLWGWSNIDGWFWFNQFATVACGLLIVGLTIFWSMLESKVSVFSSWKDSEMEVVSISSSESLSSLSLVWILSPSGVDPRSCELNLFLAAAALSRCLLFLNQFPTWVGVSPVAWASSRFLLGFGYGSWRYHSRKRLRVLSLKQWVFCSPSHIVLGSGYFFRTRYLSTGPRGRPLNF